MLPIHIYETIKFTVLLPGNRDKNHEWFFKALENHVIGLVRLDPNLGQTDDEIRSDLKAEITSLMTPIRGLLTAPSDNFDPDWTKKIDRTKWEYWPALYRYLGEYRDPVRSLSTLSSLDKTSDYVLSQIGSPEVIGQRFGLVIGYVQSGKTENFTALISKAADSGYKLIIVLSGIDDEIRGQTQDRIGTHVFGIASEFSSHGVKFPNRRWHELTSREDDFKTPSTVASNMLSDDRPTCLVIKKNGKILLRVYEWLKTVNVHIKQNLPVLIIDDEADQASPNVAVNDPDNRPTVINKRIREILGLFSKSRYIAYTATPFANFFINAETNIGTGAFGNDLYPRDFIFSLPSPPEYMGAADIYGLPPGILRDGIEVKRFEGICQPCGDPSRQINLTNIGKLSGLKDAIYSFILGTAILSLNKGNDNFPSSMIVHASHLNTDHEKHKKVIEQILSDLRELAKITTSDTLKGRFESLYSDTTYSGNIVGKFNFAKDNNFPVPQALPTFDLIWDKILYLLTDPNILKVRVVNSISSSIPKWDTPSSPDANIKCILVGGNLLSRGLTIPNLLSSYFMRMPDQADTMLQMSRWLGYRRGISYLMSVHATQACHEDLMAIAAAEQDIRNQIFEMQKLGKKPIDFQFVVRMRAGLIPTRIRAMGNADLHSETPNFAGRLLETFCFNQDDMPALKAITESNIQVLQRALLNSTSVQHSSGRHTNFCINSNAAKTLLTDLHLTGDEPSLGTNSAGTNLRDLLIQYISKRIEDSELTEWEVVICGLQSPGDYPKIEFSGITFNPVQRGRESGSHKIKNVGIGRDEFDSLWGDELTRINEEIKKIKELDPNDWSESDGSRVRSLRLPSKGKIFVYPITKFSNQNKSGSELFSSDLLDEAPNVLLAFGISLPGSRKADQQAVRGYINETTI